MIWKAPLLLFILTTSTFTFHSRASAQDINTLKTGVVRIENSKLSEVGAGFIVKIDGNSVYIVTAAHVVRGEQHPKVYLFSQQFESLAATVLDREEDNTKGLALLLLKTNEQTLSKITSLRLRNTSDLGNGETVKIIGFPGGISLWTVDNGNVKRLEGRNLVLSGAIREGNSGGPVILNQQVVGIITDIRQGDAYAMRAEIVVPYVNGIVKDLILTADPPSLTNEPQNEPDNQLCLTLGRLIEASQKGFDSIVGKPINSENTFTPNIMVPGAIDGYVYPPSITSYSILIDKDKRMVESQYYSTISNVRGCLPNWEEKESKGSSDKYHKFTRKGRRVEIYYNLNSYNGYYFLRLCVLAPTYELSH